MLFEAYRYTTAAQKNLLHKYFIKWIKIKKRRNKIKKTIQKISKDKQQKFFFSKNK